MTGIPQGLEFPVNTITAGSQQTFFSPLTNHTPRAVAIDSDGDYIVTWTGQDDGLTGIYARRYNKDGVAQDNPVTGDDLEFRVNATTAGRQAFSSVAMDADGDFVITWTSEQDDGLGSSDGIYAQRYDSAGAALGGEFLVNAPSSTDQTESTIAIAANGDFIVTWTSPDSSNTGIFAKLYRYNAMGNLIPSTAFRVNTTTANTQRASSVAMDADGDFVVTWTSNGQDGSFDGVYAQRYDKTGTAQGAEFRVNTTTVSNQQNASVSMDTAGNFVVAWSSENQDLDGFGVYAQIFNAAGDRVGGEFRVNQFTTSNQQSPSISVDADGDFVVTWSSNNQSPDSASTGIFSRRFNKSGIPQGNEFLVNTTFAGTQQYPSVAVDPNGDFVVAWTSPDGSGNGVYGQRFSPSPNSSPVDLSLTNQTVVENVTTPLPVGTFSTLDPDPGTTFTYTLVDTGSFPNNINFEIDGDKLILLVSPDYEIDKIYKIKVQTVQTSDPGGFSYSEELTITVTDVNDTAPTDLTITSTTVPENVSPGTAVGVLNNNDPDTGNTFTYTLLDPAAFPDNAAFTIDNATRELRVATPLNFETKDMYRIQVQVNDGAGGVYAEELTITVTNVNTPPTDLTITSTTVPENVSPGTAVGVLNNNDPDTGNTFTYTLLDPAAFPDNAAFTIDNATRELRVATPLNFETKDMYRIQVQVNDGAGGVYAEELTITVTNVNTPPTDLTITSTTVPENVSPGTAVGVLNNNDPDTGNTFTYTLLDPAAFPDNAAFTIDNATRELRVATPLNFETKDMYRIQVQVNDGAGGVYAEELTITVTNVNTPPTDLTITSTTVPENVSPGTAVGVLNNNDPDTGNTFTYTLLDPAAFPDNAAFTIDNATRELRVATPLNFETKDMYRIQVQVNDGAGGVYAEELTITVTNVNTPPTDLTITSTTVPENVSPGTAVGVLNNNDPDTGNTFTYTLLDPAAFPDNAAFTIDNATRELRVATPLNFETKDMYRIQVQVNDGAGGVYAEELTITVTNVNTPPTDLTITSTTVPENVSPGTAVGVLNNNDPDTGNTFTYTLLDPAAFPDNAAFTIDNATRELRVATPLNFETKDMYRIQVQVNDGAGGVYAEELTITVTNVNTPPTDLTITSTTVPENVSPGTAVGVLNNNDPDTGNTFTYTLLDPAAFPDNAAFTIDNATRELRVATPLNFETKDMYRIQVQVNDGAGGVYAEELTITVTNVNTPPTDLTITSTTVPENVSPGTAVGVLNNNDPDTGNTFTYTLLDPAAFPDNAAFTIDNATRELRVATPLNFETKDMYRIQVQVNDGAGGVYAEELTITVTNVNTPPTDLTITSTTVPENVSPGTAVGVLNNNDPDTGNTFTYTLLDPAAFPDNAAFTIDNATRELRVATPLNFETKDMYRIQVQVNDGAGGVYAEELTITVTNVNTPPTDLTITSTTVPENVSPGTAVGVLNNNDPDTGNTFTYTLLDPAAFPDNAAFTIDNATRELRVATPLNFETKDMYRIQVQVNDGAGGVYAEELTITVTNVNTPPTDLTITSTTVPENVSPGTAVGVLNNNDPDTGNTFTYTLLDPAAFPDNAAFTIDNATRELRVATPLNFETKDMYRIQVQVNDGAGGVYAEELTITVTNVNTPPTDLTITSTTVPENVSPGTAVGVLNNNDPDTGNTFTYTLLDPAAFPDNAAFTIDNATRELRVATPLNFETKDMYRIQVQVNDGAGGVYAEELTITVTNVNTPPTDLTITSTTVPENVSPGTAVGVLNNNDPDTGNTFTYTLLDPAAFPDNAAFTIDNATRELRVATPLNFETKDMYRIQVQVNDGAGGVYAEELTITVTNVNTPPTDLTITSTTVPENVSPGTAVGVLNNNDPDTGNTFTYTLLDPAAFPDNAAFTIDNATRELRVATPLNFETKDMYRIQVQVNDGAGGVYAEELTITVTNVNTPPTDLTITSTTVPENVSPGTAVGVLNNNDPDTGNTFTYTLLDPAAFPDNAAFTIDNATRELRVATPLNFETKDMYRIQVQVNDGAGGVYAEELTITVTNVNTPPTDLTITSTTVPENVSPGTAVGVLNNNDPDTGNTFTYTLLDPAAFPDNAAFTIDNATRELRVATPLNFETKDMYRIQVQVNDGAGGVYAEELTITVTNVNTPPTDLTITSTTVPENVSPGTAVGVLNNNDPDTGNTFTYTLLDPAAFPDNAAFTIDNATRELRVATPLNFETKDMYRIQVQVNDGAGGVYAEELTITVTNVEEAPPNQRPTDLVLTNNSVQENVLANTVIGSFTTADPDINDTFTYSLVSSATVPDNAAFTIDGGVLRIAVSPDFETKRNYSIRVRTTDQSGGFFEKNLAIAVADVDESNPGNGAPVLDLNGTAAGINGSAAAATGGAIQLVSAGATLTDADSLSLNSALVIISNSFDAPNETLTANTSGTNITATYSTTGVLNLTGIASLATYLQVLRSVTYTNSAPIPNTIPRNVLFIVSDGRNNSQVATTTLTLDSRNLVTGSDRNDLSLVTTPVTDVIDAEAGNDVVTSIAAYLKQQDSINGGDGVDTLVLQDGTGNLTVRVADTTNQLPDISAGTTVSNFEQFDLKGFTGNVDILGSATLDDNLTTGSGNDTLNGAGGNDVLAGNQGNDLYIVDSVGDRITEALNAGTDTVQSSINYALSADLENLTLTANAVNGTGNTLNNVLTGNAGANTLKGGAGNDTLLGGGKSDKLVGGAGDDVLDGQRGKKDRLKGGQGNDSFVLSTARGFGPDEILGFKPANDTILFSRSSAGVSIDLGAIAASQFVYGSAAQDSGDRFLYNRQSGALLFDSDGTGSARALLIATFKNKPTLTAADIVAI